jgi:hypothetical protein
MRMGYLEGHCFAYVTRPPPTDRCAVCSASSVA